LFHNANLFGSCIIHILYTGCAKIKKNNSGAKGLTICDRMALVNIPFSSQRPGKKIRTIWLHGSKKT